MDTSALAPFLEAVRDLDPDKLSAALAEDIVMRGPILAEPFSGRDQVLPVLGLVFNMVEDFRLGEILAGPDVFAIALTGRIGAEDIEGMEYLHLDAQGKIDRFTVFIRPLAGLVALQNRLAPSFGMPAFSLTPVD